MVELYSSDIEEKFRLVVPNRKSKLFWLKVLATTGSLPMRGYYRQYLQHSYKKSLGHLLAANYNTP